MSFLRLARVERIYQQHLTITEVPDDPATVAPVPWSWGATDLSELTGGPPAPGDFGVHAFSVQSQIAGLEGVTLFVTYIALSNEVHQLEYQFALGAWKDSNLSAQVGQAALAPTEKPAAYLFRAQGTAHVIYLGSASPSSQDLQIQEFWHDQNGWHANNLTRAAGGAPSPARTSPVAYAAEFQQTQHVHYVGGDGHLHELWWDTDGWHHNDLTAASGAPLAQLGTSPAGFVSEAAQTQHVYFIGQDSQLHGIRWKAGNWSRHEPLGGMPEATTASPVGYISDDGFERVSYVGLDGHVHELSLGDAWDLQDPSLKTNTSVDPNAELAAYSGLEAGTRQIIVIPGGGGSIQQLSFTAGRWTSAVLLDSNGPEAGMGADAGARPGAFAVPAAQKEYVYYPSINFRVVELWPEQDLGQDQEPSGTGRADHGQGKGGYGGKWRGWYGAFRTGQIESGGGIAASILADCADKRFGSHLSEVKTSCVSYNANVERAYQSLPPAEVCDAGDRGGGGGWCEANGTV